MRYDDDFDPYQPPRSSSSPRSKRYAMSSTYEFTITDVLNRSWQIFRSQMFQVIFTVFVSFIIGQTVSFTGLALSESQDESIKIIGALMAIFGTFFAIFIQAGLFTYLLNLASGRTARFSDLFSAGAVFLKLVGASILVTILGYLAIGAFSLVTFGLAAVLSPIVLFIAIPFGVILYLFIIVRFSQAYYLLVDREVGVIDALRLSAEIMTGKMLQFILFVIVLIFINFFGALALLVGLFVTIPLTMVATTVYYLAASGQPIADPFAYMGYDDSDD